MVYLMAKPSGGFTGSLQSTCPKVTISVPLRGPWTEGGRESGSIEPVTTACKVGSDLPAIFSDFFRFRLTSFLPWFFFGLTKFRVLLRPLSLSLFEILGILQ